MIIIHNAKIKINHIKPHKLGPKTAFMRLTNLYFISIIDIPLIVLTNGF